MSDKKAVPSYSDVVRCSGERDAFCVMVRKTDIQFAAVYDTASDYAKGIIDGECPSDSGGWIHFRFRNEEECMDNIRIV